MSPASENTWGVGAAFPACIQEEAGCHRLGLSVILLHLLFRFVVGPTRTSTTGARRFGSGRSASTKGTRPTSWICPGLK